MKSSKIHKAKVISNQEVARDHFLMEFETVMPVKSEPGQFVNVCLPSCDHLVPRPFSIWSVSGNRMQILYKIFGEGTRILSQVQKGFSISVLMPLGNSFPKFLVAKHIALVCGGIGIVPLYYYAAHMISQRITLKHHLTLYYGASTSEGLVMQAQIQELGIQTLFATDDGSVGYKGNSLDLFLKDNQSRHAPADVVFACGPKPFMRALGTECDRQGLEAYLAEEEVMGCGFGACVGCVIPLKDSQGTRLHKLVCVDGPVFRSSAIDWEHYH